MISQKQYPPKDGWILATLTMKSRELVDRKQIERILSAGNPEEYEFPEIEQHGAKVKAVFRRKPGSEVAA